MQCFSFRTHPDGSVTWVRWRAFSPSQAPPQKCGGDAASQKDGMPTKGALKRIERYRSYRERMTKAVKFHCFCAMRCVLRYWKLLLSRRSDTDGTPQPTVRSPGDGPPGPALCPSGAGGASPSRAPSEREAEVSDPMQAGDAIVPPHRADDPLVPPHGAADRAAAEAGNGHEASPPRKQPRQGAAADSPPPLLCGAGSSNRHARENARVHAIMGPPVPAVGGPQESAHVCVHMHSPAGGAHPSASMLPPIAGLSDAMGPLGGSTYV